MQQHSELDSLQTSGSKSRVLLGLTGSVAALKAPLLVRQLLEIPEVGVFIYMYIPFISVLFM